MTREELLTCPEYWLLEIQMDLFNIIEKYMKENNLNRKQLADKLGYTKGYITQILKGDFDHRISKLVELALAIGKAPKIKYEDITNVLIRDKRIHSTKKRKSHTSSVIEKSRNNSKPVIIPPIKKGNYKMGKTIKQKA